MPDIDTSQILTDSKYSMVNKQMRKSLARSQNLTTFIVRE